MWNILISIFTVIILLVLFYYYLEWCNNNSGKLSLYKTDPIMVTDEDKAYIDSYGWLMLPKYLSDSFKPIRFQILYYWNKMLVMFGSSSLDVKK